jgi:hypothetical protein
MSRRATALLLALFLSGASRSLIAEPSGKSTSGLTLKIGVDRSEFLPGEPVMIGLTVENHGSQPFEDLSTLSPATKLITFRVMKDGKLLAWGGLNGDWMFTKEGPRLAPGGRLCEVVDLLEYYGTRQMKISCKGRTFAFRHALEPGHYSVRAGFRARMGVRRDLSQLFLESNEIGFTVRDAAAIPQSELGALEVLQVGEGRGSRVGSLERWRDIQSRGLLDSRYLVAIAREYLPSEDSVDVVPLAEGLVDSGGSVLCAAGLLRVRYEHYHSRLNACEAWLHRAEQEGTGRFTCFLRMWEEVVALGRKYGWAED